MRILGYDGRAIAQVFLRRFDIQEAAQIAQLANRIGDQLLEIHVMNSRGAEPLFNGAYCRAACEVVVDLTSQVSICVFSAQRMSLAKSRGDGIKGVPNDVNELLFQRDLT